MGPKKHFLFDCNIKIHPFKTADRLPVNLKCDSNQLFIRYILILCRHAAHAADVSNHSTWSKRSQRHDRDTSTNTQRSIHYLMQRFNVLPCALGEQLHWNLSILGASSYQATQEDQEVIQEVALLLLKILASAQIGFPASVPVQYSHSDEWEGTCFLKYPMAYSSA